MSTYRSNEITMAIQMFFLFFYIIQVACKLLGCRRISVSHYLFMTPTFTNIPIAMPLPVFFLYQTHIIKVLQNYTNEQTTIIIVSKNFDTGC